LERERRTFHARAFPPAIDISPLAFRRSSTSTASDTERLWRALDRRPQIFVQIPRNRRGSASNRGGEHFQLARTIRRRDGNEVTNPHRLVSFGGRIVQLDLSSVARIASQSTRTERSGGPQPTIEPNRIVVRIVWHAA
jgi:hypothetical protein